MANALASFAFLVASVASTPLPTAASSTPLSDSEGCDGDIAALFNATNMTAAFLTALHTKAGEDALQSTMAAVRSASACPLDEVSDYMVWRKLLHGDTPPGCAMPPCDVTVHLGTRGPTDAMLTLNETLGACAFNYRQTWNIVHAYKPVYRQGAYDDVLLSWIAQRGEAGQMGFAYGTPALPGAFVELYPPKQGAYGMAFSDCSGNSTAWARLPPRGHDASSRMSMVSEQDKAHNDAWERLAGSQHCFSASPIGRAGSYHKVQPLPGPGFTVTLVEEGHGPNNMTGGALQVTSFGTDEDQARYWRAFHAANVGCEGSVQLFCNAKCATRGRPRGSCDLLNASLC